MPKSKNHLPRFGRPVVYTLMLVTGLIVVSVCGYIVFMMAYIEVGRVHTVPDPALLPTADYLIANPQPTLPGVEIDLDGRGWHKPFLCYLKEEKNSFLKYYRWHELYLNGSRVPIAKMVTMSWSPDFRDHCISDSVTPLSPGVHLFEFQLRQQPWDTPFVYQWAVRVPE